MRKLIAAVVFGLGALTGASAMAADMPYYTPVETLPAVDVGLGGSFYLRGSAAGNGWWAKDMRHDCLCGDKTFNQQGYGYSVGVGFGYETGTGLRADVTYDYLRNNGMTLKNGYKSDLRSSLVLANVYYDFGLGGRTSAGGGFGLYVGAGLGFARNDSEVFNTGGTRWAWGDSIEAAGAVMTGVTYDMGAVVADVGYRGIYMDKVMSTPDTNSTAYIVNQNYIHEVRSTLRYRF